MSSPQRLQIELEFVQSLANPAYLHFLVQEKYLEDAKFIAYLHYLGYLRRPEYARLIVYPNGLEFLKLLQEASFRQKLSANPAGIIDFIHKQQFYHWLHSGTPIKPS